MNNLMPACPPTQQEYLQELLAIQFYSQDVQKDLPPRAGWTKIPHEQRQHYRNFADTFARSKL